MNGIAGIWRRDGHLRKEDVDRQLSTLGVARGARLAVGCVAFGHGGRGGLPEDHFDRQPIQHLESGTALVADLRLDNRAILVDRLSLPPSVLKTRSDCWFLLQAWLRWGEACAEHLLGDFAAAIWDGQRQSLTLLRDHMGQRPLYYFQTPELFVFASSVRAILAHPEVPRRLSPRVLAEYLANGFPALQGNTIYEDIAMLPAATVLSVPRDRPPEMRSYWRPEADPDMIDRPEREYEEAYRSVLGQAVHDRLRSIGNPGLLLSGGFDSTAIAALAGAPLSVQGRKLIAVTHITSDPTTAPGGDRARDWTQHCSDHMPHLDLRPVKNPGASMLDGLVGAIGRQGAPPLTDHYAYSALLRTAAAAGARTVMTGDGGDFTLNHRGNGFLAWLLATGRIGAFLSEYRAHLKRTSDTVWTTFTRQILRPLLPYSVRERWRWLRGRQPNRYRQIAVNQDFIRDISSAGPAFHWRDDRPLLPGPDFLSRRRIVLARRMNRPIVDFADEARELGMNLTLPYLDRRVVELSLALPHNLIVRDGWNRHLARRALAEILPPRYQVRDRSNRDGVAIEALRDHRRDVANLMGEADRLRRSGACDEVDFDGLKQLLQAEQGSPQADDMLFQAMHVISVARFLEWYRQPNRQDA